MVQDGRPWVGGQDDVHVGSRGWPATDSGV